MDFSGVLAGLDSATAVAAIIGAGVIIVGPGFAKWATRKVASLFG